MVESLLALGLLLIVAKLLEGVAICLRQSSLVAYVAAGIILGSVLGLIEPTDNNFPELFIFFGIGVIFMFFLIGVDEMGKMRALVQMNKLHRPKREREVVEEMTKLDFGG